MGLPFYRFLLPMQEALYGTYTGDNDKLDKGLRGIAELAKGAPPCP
jgi:hypothetical protein